VEKLQEFSDARENRDKTRFARLTRSIFNTAAVVLGLLIAYLQIKHIKPDLLLTTSSADIVWRVALVAYYWSWVGGANFDTNIQELAYTSFPGHGRWPLQSYAVLTILVLMGAVLLVTYENIAHFSLALTGFLLADYGSWFYLRRFLRQSVDDSQAAYAAGSRFYELEILKIVRDYIFGRWKVWRLMVGAVFVITADLFAFNRAFQEATANAVQIICPWLSAGDSIFLSYSVFFLLYVLVMESWLWLNRLQVYLRVLALEYLNGLYHLTPRQNGTASLATAHRPRRAD
jgi:hypothetical protein